MQGIKRKEIKKSRVLKMTTTDHYSNSLLVGWHLARIHELFEIVVPHSLTLGSRYWRNFKTQNSGDNYVFETGKRFGPLFL